MAKIEQRIERKKLCAHRGYHNARNDNDPKRFLENTFEAFVEAYKWVDIAECDVQILKDDTIILAHDSTLFRVSAISNTVQSATDAPVIQALELTPRSLEKLNSLNETPLADLFFELLSESPRLQDLWEASQLNDDGYNELSEGRREQVQWLLSHTPLWELTYQQALRVPLKRGSSAPKLESILELLRLEENQGKHLVIEMKPGNRRIVKPLLRLFEKMSVWESVSLMSFDAELMKALHSTWAEEKGEDKPSTFLNTYWLVCSRIYPEIETQGLGYFADEKSIPKLCDQLQKIGTQGIYLEFNETTVTRPVLEAFGAAGFRVGIWSGRAEHENWDVIRFLSQSGAEVINTDEPRKLVEVL